MEALLILGGIIWLCRWAWRKWDDHLYPPHDGTRDTTTTQYVSSMPVRTEHAHRRHPSLRNEALDGSARLIGPDLLPVDPMNLDLTNLSMAGTALPPLEDHEWEELERLRRSQHDIRG